MKQLIKEYRSVALIYLITTLIFIAFVVIAG